MLKSSIYILIIILLTSCQQRDYKTILVKGNIKNATANKVSLISFGATNSPIVFDTCTIDKKGNYSLKTLANDEELYAIKVGDAQEIWFVNDAQEIIINANVTEYKNYQTIGSPASQALHIFISKFDSLISIQQNIDINIDTLTQQKGKDSLGNIAKVEKKSIKTIIKDYCTSCIVNTNNPALKYFYLFYSNNTNAIEVNDVYRMVQSACKQFPKHNQLLGLKNSMSDIVKSNPKLFLINEPATDFNYVDSANNKISLRTFSGKYLLLDFWESSNKEYRQHTATLSETYKEFKDKKFEILSVSLDSNKKVWQKAIIQDSLCWMQVQDTLRYKSGFVKKYYLTSLPYNILINPTGKIIAIDIRGDALKEKLKELLTP
jgi:peroxiredoxin